MALRKERPGKEWVDEAIRHLTLLCQQAVECADEGDVLPTAKEIASAQKLLQRLGDAPAPKLGLTVNGEIALTWDNASDTFKAYVKQDGTFRFYQNKVAVDQWVRLKLTSRE